MGQPMLLKNILKMIPELQGHLPEETETPAVDNAAETAATATLAEAAAATATLPETATVVTPEESWTPGAPTEGSLGDRVLQRVRETDSRALPLPSDYANLQTECLTGIYSFTLNPTPCSATEAAVRQYLQAQGISLQSAVDLHLGYTHHTFVREGKDRNGEEVKQYIDLPALAYPAEVLGQVVSVKLRSCQYDPAAGEFTKDFTQITQPHSELSLAPFHIDCLSPRQLRGERIERLILTEGEKDCLALYEAGYRHFISVPTGASSTPDVYLKPFIGWLKAVDQIVLCGDTDLPGRRMVESLGQFFGGQSLRVTFPAGCKDIADVLRLHGVDEVRRVISQAHVPESEAVVTVNQLRRSVLDIIDGHYDHGYDLGYGPLTDEHFHLDHNGNLVVVSGQPNSGKSSYINDLAMHLIKKHHRKFLFASFEYPNKASHVALMLKIYFGQETLSNVPRRHLEQALDLIDAHLAHLDLKGILPTPDHILNEADQYLHRSGLDFLVIDPYVFIQHESVSKNESETDQIKRMLTKFQSWGQQHHVTVIIVAHPRKTQTAKGGFTSDQLSPDDIAGSAHWKNLADFLFVIRRVDTETERYSELIMYKVRDQQLCTPGNVYYVRTAWGEFIEQPSITECTQWYMDHNLM